VPTSSRVTSTQDDSTRNPVDRKSRYRMIVSDIDGTLLNSSSELTPSVRSAIADARMAGVIFTLATGRRYVTTEKIVHELGLAETPSAPFDRPRSEGIEAAILNPPLVLQTGAAIVTSDGKHLLLRDPVPIADAQLAVRMLIDAGLQPILYEDRVQDQRLFTGPIEFDSEAATKYLSNNPHLVVRVPYAELPLDDEVLQIAVIDSRDRLEQRMPPLGLANCRTLLSYSGNLDSCFMEIFHRDCTKGRAVARLATYLGFAIEDTVCIGDNWNDIEMLAAAGCGIAVANAEPGVAPFARRLTVSNDADAVALVIRQILAGEEPGEVNPEYKPLTHVKARA
jgi:hydroxymethylpyrimidine pyrophosphatase-like HAD family hydrolase